MKKVEFIVDFATKTKGDIFECDSMLASHLVNIDKVAKYYNKEEVKKEATKVKL